MTGSSTADVVGGIGLSWETLVHTSHRYVLPVLSGISFFVGGILLDRGPGALGPWAPLASLALGTGALSSSLAYLRWRRSATPSAPGPPIPVSSEPSAALCAQCSSAIPPSLEWEDLFFGRFDVPARSPGAAGTLRVLFTPTSAADQLWVHWLPAEVGQLPSELVGPIPESAYYPPEPGAPPIDSREEIVFPRTHEEPTLGGSIILEAARPPSQEPPVEPDGLLVPAATEPVTGSPPALLPTSVSAAHRALAPSSAEPEVPNWMRSILAEAMNPVPPHLRTDTGPNYPRPAALGVA